MSQQTITITRTENPAAQQATPVNLTRRELLRGSGILIGTLALSSSLALIAPSRVWALELRRLTTRQGEVLLMLGKQMFPHHDLDDAVYALLVKALDRKAIEDSAQYTLLVAGVAALDQKARPADWTKRPAATRLTDIKAMSTTPFFELVRSTAIVTLYSNALAYKHFAYRASEGDAGYLFNGFDDLAWLPDPPAQDSGPMPTQQ